MALALDSANIGTVPIESFLAGACAQPAVEEPVEMERASVAMQHLEEEEKNFTHSHPVSAYHPAPTLQPARRARERVAALADREHGLRLAHVTRRARRRRLAPARLVRRRERAVARVRRRRRVLDRGPHDGGAALRGGG